MASNAGYHRAGFLFAVALLAAVGSSRAQTTNLYVTGFERAQGFDPAYELVGQQGWTSDFAGTNGNGLITNFYGSFAAYVGVFPLQPPASALSVWYPVNYTPTTKAPVVRFSCAMAIYDSTTTNRDDFFWSVYNTKGDRLFTLDFNNDDLGIYYLLDGNSSWVDTGWSFENDAVYDLELVMDFGLNQWSAYLGGAQILTNRSITTTNAQLTFGDADAVWAVYIPTRPGDNFMVFDDYTIRAEARAVVVPPRATLQPMGALAGGQFLVRVTGTNGLSYAVEGSTNLVNWVPLKTNVIAGGYFDYLDTGSVGLNRRYYRARFVP
jgi:hypothetical protein